MTGDYSANETRSLRTLRVGREESPIIVIDDFLQKPSTLLDFASSSQFGKPKNWYPGLRAEPLPQPYVMEAIRALHTVIASAFGLPVNGQVDTNTYFGIATTPPEGLSPLQRVPHFDTSNPRQIAILHYLCTEEHGGTAFYRHRATGYETIGVERQQAYYGALEAELKAALPPARYMSGDDSLYEEVARVEAGFNRMLIYRSGALHSANVNAAFGLRTDPRAGRLTANIFLAYR